jgi:F0F1-type ATP synthase membrane subunit b/b'
MADRLRSRYSSFMEKIFKRAEANGHEITEERQAKIDARKEKFEAKIESVVSELEAAEYETVLVEN